MMRAVSRESVPCDVELLSVSRDDIVSGYTRDYQA